MQAIKEVGFKKAFKFIVFSFYHLFYRILPFPQLRKLYLILGGAKIGNESIIMDLRFFNWHHLGLKGLEIGKECFVGDETLIDLYNKVVIQDRVSIAQRVIVLTHINVGYKNHPLQRYFPSKNSPVIIESGSVIGAGSIILPGITIGERSMVGAGSVVTKNVASMTLVAGVPARTIKKLG